jgi:hypothetical protein
MPPYVWTADEYGLGHGDRSPRSHGLAWLSNRPDDGCFIPSQLASNEEDLALKQVLSEFGVSSIGWSRGAAERPLWPEKPELLGGEAPDGGWYSEIDMDTLLDLSNAWGAIISPPNIRRAWLAAAGRSRAPYAGWLRRCTPADIVAQ